MSEGAVYLGLEDGGKFVALSPDDGQWRYVKLGLNDYYTNNFENGVKFGSVHNEDIYFCHYYCDRGVILKADVNTGNIRWIYSDYEYPFSMPVGAVGGQNGLVYTIFNRTPSNMAQYGEPDYEGGLVQVLKESIHSHFLSPFPLENTFYTAITVDRHTNQLVVLDEHGCFRSFSFDDRCLKKVKYWTNFLPGQHYHDSDSDSDDDQYGGGDPDNVSTEKIPKVQSLFKSSHKDMVSLASNRGLVYLTSGYAGLVDVMHSNGGRCCIVASTTPCHKTWYVAVGDNGNVWLLVSDEYDDDDDDIWGVVYCFPPVFRYFPLPSFPPPLSYLSEVAVHVHQDDLPVSLLPPRYTSLFPEWSQIVEVQVKPWQACPRSIELRLKTGMSLGLVQWMIRQKLDLSSASDMTVVAISKDGGVVPRNDGSLHKDTAMICLLL